MMKGLIKAMTNEKILQNAAAYWNALLYAKMNAEMQAYEKELLAMQPTEILENAYAYATKKDILLALEYFDVSEQQAKALLEYDNALESVYDRWQDTESAYMNNVRDMITCTANAKIRENFIAQRKKEPER